LEPQDAYIHYALGRCYLGMADYSRAAAALDTSIALWPKFHGSYYWRGGAHAELKEYKLALEDFDEAIRLRGNFLPARLDRALVRSSANDFPRALDDLNYVVNADPSQTRVYFIRAMVRARAGDHDGARRDRELGMQRTPGEELSWIARGVARLGTDPKGCLADLEEALKINPCSQAALQDKAHVLAEKLGRSEEAIAVLDQAIALYPDYSAARTGRGVLLARLGRRQAALKDAEESIRLDTAAKNLYQAAGIYALTSRYHPDDSLEAFRLLSAALRGGFGFDLLAVDHDLDPIRKNARFRGIVEAAQALQAENIRQPGK
jgi:tetratricopeptide (TPR) repeat protein